MFVSESRDAVCFILQMLFFFKELFFLLLFLELVSPPKAEYGTTVL